MAYLITGATGDIGTRVVELLVRKVSDRGSWCATHTRQDRASEIAWT